jgi:hypothetical protein
VTEAIAPNVSVAYFVSGSRNYEIGCNCRSVCNKAINDFVVENDIELLCITETWLNANNRSIINELIRPFIKSSHSVV